MSALKLAVALSQLRKLKAREITEKEARSKCDQNPDLESWLLNTEGSGGPPRGAPGHCSAKDKAAGEGASYQSVEAENLGLQ